MRSDLGNLLKALGRLDEAKVSTISGFSPLAKMRAKLRLANSRMEFKRTCDLIKLITGFGLAIF